MRIEDLFKEKIYDFRGVPISSRALMVFFIIMGLLIIIQYFVGTSIGLFGFVFGTPTEIENFTEEQFTSLKIFIMMVPLYAGPSIWLFGHLESFRLVKWLFHLQRLSFFHLILSTKQIPLTDVFLLKHQGKWYEAMIIVFIGMWSLAFILNHFFGSLILSDVSTTDQWSMIILTSFFSVISYIIVCPLTILYSTNIRIKLRSKNFITSGFSLYKYLILSLFSLNLAITTISGIQFEHIFTIDIVFFIPSIVLSVFFTIFSKNILTSEFRNQLKKHGILEGDIV